MAPAVAAIAAIVTSGSAIAISASCTSHGTTEPGGRSP